MKCKQTNYYPAVDYG